MGPAPEDTSRSRTGSNGGGTGACPVPSGNRAVVKRHERTEATARPPRRRPHAHEGEYQISDEIPATRGRRALRHAGRGARFAGIAILPFVILVTLAAVMGYVRLRHGPISLGFLVAPIERSINAELTGYVARIGDAIVKLTDDHRLEFRLADVSFAEPDGDTVASAPLASVQISHKALYAGKLVPSRIELIEPRLYLSYAPHTGLSLSFTPSASAAATAAPADAVPATAEPPAAATTHKKLDPLAFVQRMTGQAGNGEARTFLREIGLRDAVVLVDHDGAKSQWRVPELAIDLDHRQNRTIISGQASVASDHGAWTGTFHTEHDGGQLKLIASVRDLVPAAFASASGPLPFLSRFDLPVGIDLSLAVTPQGEVANGDIAVELGRGRVVMSSPEETRQPLDIEQSLLRLNYDAATGKVRLAPSTLRWGASSATLAGEATPATIDGIAGWQFDIASTEGVMAAPEFGAKPVAIDALSLRGAWLQDADRVRFDGLDVRAGGAEFHLEGEMSVSAARPGLRLQARLGEVPLPVLKAIWPSFIAPKTRRWVGGHADAGVLKGLTWRLARGVFLDTSAPVPHRGAQTALVVETGPGTFRPSNDLPPVSTPRVLVQVENDALELTMPEATMQLPSGKTLPFKSVRMTSPDVDREPSESELSFRSQGDIAPVIELLAMPPLSALGSFDPAKFKLQGKVDAQLAMSFPLVADLHRSQIRFNGKARLTDGKAQNVLGERDVQGATVAVDFANGGVEAKGEALVSGVLAKIGWQRLLDAPDDRQPPLRITTTLDNTDRTQLGLDINHMLHGEVPVDIQVTPGANGAESKVHVRADLTNAELILDAISWAKPPGRSAFAEFDVASVAGGKQELQNFRVAGDNIAIEGWAGVGADGKLREFYFPEFSLNVVTRLKVQGSLGNDGVWAIKANGPTFDGKDFFRALFSVGRVSEHQDAGGKQKGGIDLEANVDTVLGFSDLSLRALKLTLARRTGKLTALEARGTLDGGAPVAVVLDRDGQGQRRIRADSTDAGQVFKLTGFYPNIQGGRVRLEVNVEGAGAAEKTGTLWVEDFRVLGDAVIAEVVSSVDEGRPSISSGTVAGRGGRRVVREVLDFDTMRVPFSVGHGQFVMEDAYVRGPLLGATIRGKVDYKSERMTLGGTYIPLQGLNNAFGQIPVLGQILSGPRGEGIFGITFAIQGAMANPQVIVNPLSLVTPGIFREVFQMTNPSPKVQPRKSEGKAATPRASSSAPMAGPASDDDAPATTIDGWSSETTTTTTTRKR